MEGYRLHPLLSREEIHSIVKGLADRISNDYGQRELVLIGILKGAFMFLSDLARHLRGPVEIDFVRLASYGSGMKSSGNIAVTKDVETSLEGKDVLIVEDLIDSGRTLLFLKERIARANPRSVKICALLDKKPRREVALEGDYVGKEIEDIFIVGYGIDFNEAYRNLPEIYYVTPLQSPKE
jgi:hypoxanthine phosphoribosyltransferase